MLLLFIRIPGFVADAITAVSIVFAGPAGQNTRVPTSKRFRDYVCEKNEAQKYNRQEIIF